MGSLMYVFVNWTFVRGKQYIAYLDCAFSIFYIPRVAGYIGVIIFFSYNQNYLNLLGAAL